MAEYEGLSSSHFKVEIDRVILASFRKVSGLEREYEVTTSWFNTPEGKTIFKRQRGNVKEPPNIVLERMIDGSVDLWEWFKMTEQGDIEKARRNGSIVAYDSQNKEVARWDFTNGWVAKWVGAEFDASKGDIAVEKVEITHEYLERG